MPDFILEIGTEELPARFLENEEKELLENFLKALDDAGLEHGEARCMATPRRLALYIVDIADTQKSGEEIITGPPASSAYDKDGKAGKSLSGFLKGHGLRLEDTFIHKTAKGEYIAARKKTGGRTAFDLLMEICPAVIAGLHFPKRMRWGSNTIAYARPIRWILALYGDKPLPFEFGPVKADRFTFGHRIHGIGPHAVGSAKEWFNTLLEDGHVVADPIRRREHISAEGNRLAGEKAGKVVWKDSLLDEVCGLVEQPVPILGDFDSAYLEIPEEVLLTSMESHQKSFGLRGSDGKLLPHFLTVLNLKPKDLSLVKKGWERVLRARLEDARFFWRADLGDNFENWLNKLENVIYIGSLGSMGDKSRRLEKLSQWLCEQVAPLDPALAARAGRLAKADLVSSMVGEFDSLQGIMGGIYAARFGEDGEVAKAIREQYLPAGPDSPLPQSTLGAVLSIADKADALAGCFGLNMIPGGMADPNGLRRCAIGIIRILLDRGWDVRTSALFNQARNLYGDKKWKLSPEDALSRLMDFMKARLRAWYIARGYDTLMVDAVLANGVERIADSKARLDALAAFGNKENFLESARILKRVDNISREVTQDSEAWKEELLQEEAEKELASTLKDLSPVLEGLLEKGAYAQMLEELEKLAAPVNGFFEKVMVNCEDKAVRLNRLRLLRALASPYARIARFSMLQV